MGDGARYLYQGWCAGCCVCIVHQVLGTWPCRSALSSTQARWVLSAYLPCYHSTCQLPTPCAAFCLPPVRGRQIRGLYHLALV